MLKKNKLLLILCSLMISASVMFGQELPQLKVTERDLSMTVFGCAGNDQTVVQIQSNLPLTFDSNMDKTTSYCSGSPREENGFFWYELQFPTNTEYKKYDGRKLTIQSRGFEYYILPLDLKAKTPVGFLVINETKRKADDFYDAGKYLEARREYEKLFTINPNDDVTIRRIATCNERISPSVTDDNGMSVTNTVVNIDALSSRIIDSKGRIISSTSSYKGCGIEIMAYDLYEGKRDWRDINCPEGWRLPTREELQCMCEAQKNIGNFKSDSWNPAYFTKNFAKKGKHYVRTFDDCQEREQRFDARVRCVKINGDQAEQKNTVEPVEAIIVCGLEIMATEPEKYKWEDAQHVCPQGWRLPTSQELKCLCNNEKQIGGFAGDEYWTGNSSIKKEYKAISITVNDGKEEVRDKYDEYCVRCVRDAGR